VGDEPGVLGTELDDAVDAGEEDRVLVPDELRHPYAGDLEAVAGREGAGAHHPLRVADLDARARGAYGGLGLCGGGGHSAGSQRGVRWGMFVRGWAVAVRAPRSWP